MKKSRRQKSYIDSDHIPAMRLSGLVQLVGRATHFEIERDVDEIRIDHVWIDVEAGDKASFRIAVNRWSRLSFASAFDPRVRVAIIASRWNERPQSGVFPSEALDYSAIEMKNGSGFEPSERTALEQLLIEKFERAILIQAWGKLYKRGHRGLHQLHSRRASAVVKTDYIGRDGALCFYYKNDAGETLLFKFFGQSYRQ